MEKIKNKIHASCFMPHASNEGYVAFIIVLTISVVVLGVVTTAALLSIGEAQSSFALFNGENTFQFVDGCAEDAILQVEKSPTYNGGTITRPEGTCSITALKSGSIWTLTVTTTATSYKRTEQIVLKRSSTITITSWQEI